MRISKSIALASLLVAAAGALTAAAADVPDRIKKAGKLVAATQPNYPPIAYKDPASNTLTGFDIDLGEAIAKELGLKIEWQETAFAQMISSLQTQRVDIALAGMSDLPARREVVDFIDYMKTGPQFFTTANRAGELKTIEDVDLLYKPYRATDLAEKIQALLERPQPQARNVLPMLAAASA